MPLDYSKKLDSIFDTGVTIGEENVQEPPPVPLQQIQNSLKPQYIDSERTENIYKQYQENRLKANQGMTDIIMGAANGITPYKLFFTAIEVIDSLVNDGGIFVQTVKQNLDKVADRAIKIAAENGYSYSAEPKKAELPAAKDRLERLQQALSKSAGDNRKRIENAIKEHEKLIAVHEKEVFGAAERKEPPDTSTFDTVSN